MTGNVLPKREKSTLICVASEDRTRRIQTGKKRNLKRTFARRKRSDVRGGGEMAKNGGCPFRCSRPSKIEKRKDRNCDESGRLVPSVPARLIN